MSELKVEIAPDEVGLDAARLERIQRYLKRYVDDGRLPGFLVAVTRRGQVAYLAAGGDRHVEEGAFELSDPISRFLPAFADTGCTSRARISSRSPSRWPSRSASGIC